MLKVYSKQFSVFTMHRFCTTYYIFNSGSKEREKKYKQCPLHQGEQNGFEHKAHRLHDRWILHHWHSTRHYLSHKSIFRQIWSCCVSFELNPSKFQFKNFRILSTDLALYFLVLVTINAILHPIFCILMSSRYRDTIRKTFLPSQKSTISVTRNAGSMHTVSGIRINWYDYIIAYIDFHKYNHSFHMSIKNF